jgi:hypothetical protein
MTLLTIKTPENPYDILAKLEESMELDNKDESLWSGVIAPEMKCGQVEYIWHIHNIVKMAHKYAKSYAKEEVKLPDEFKHHAALFSDEEAKKFPLS